VRASVDSDRKWAGLKAVWGVVHSYEV